MVHTLDPAGVGCADLRECLLLQIESRNGKGGVAWQIVARSSEAGGDAADSRNWRGCCTGRMEHIQIAMDVIRHLDPRPGLALFGSRSARQVEPDVYISKDGEDYLIQVNDDDIPQLRLNPQYRRMLDRNEEPNKEVRNYVKERYASAIQLMKNIEQRKQTILKVCQCVVRRQMDFLEHGIDYSEADDDQGNRRRDRRASVHRQPRGFEQIRAHSAGRFRAAIFLLRGGAGPSGGATAAADPEAPRQKND